MKKIIIILSLLFTIFSFAPSLFEIIQSKNIPSDRIFVLEHNYMFDYNFYLSRVREGQEGRWTVVEKYYNAPHSGSLFQIFYLVAGKIGGFIGLTPPFIYHALRIILGFILLVLIGLYGRSLLSGGWAILAYLFVATGGSWPILVKIGPPAGEFYRFATYMGYWSAIDSLQRITFLPHVLLGQIFILIFIWVFGSRENQQLNLQRLLFWGIIGLIVGIIFPPTLIVVYTVFAVLSLFELWDLKTFKISKIKLRFKQLAVPRLFFILLSIPSFLYLQLMFKIWPWKALALFDVLHRMPLQYKEYFMALGPILPFGLIGLGVAVIKRERKLFPVVSWVIAVLLLFLVFEKVPTQSPLRFTEALIHIPLGILSVYFFYIIWNWCSKQKRSRVMLIRSAIGIVVTLILLIGIGIMVSMLGWLTDQGRAKKEATWVVPIGAQLSYPLKDFMDGIYYLRDNTKKEEVVLSYITAGNFIPAYAGNFVYIGHANTPNEDEKEKIAARFFAGKMSAEEAKEFLTKERISYIFFGSQERELGKIDNLSQTYPYIQKVYFNKQVILYRY